MDNSEYGICEDCNVELEPIWFKEAEYRTDSGIMTKTGRFRSACSHLTCPSCLKDGCVDDTFDGNWYKE